MKIATSNYVIESFNHFSEYQQKILAIIEEAKKNKADLLLLPEYAGVELAFEKHDTDEKVFASASSNLDIYLHFFSGEAQKNKMYLQPGTILIKVAEHQYANRAYFFSPLGQVAFQDKLQLTAYEKDSQLIAQGKTQTLFETSFGKIGIAICYDCEFPEIVRNLTFEGAQLILVPSYTSSLAGFYRVFLSARARAIENQCYVATAFVTGQVASGDSIEQTTGHAAILSPADIGFPDDGVIAQTKTTEPQLLFAELALEKLNTVRDKGNVHNFQDGKNQSLLGAPLCLPF